MRDRVENDEVVVDSRTWQPPSAMEIVSVVIGAALVIIGIVVLLRGDVSGSWRDPVVSIAGLEHTPLLGVIEIAAGALIVIAGLTSRGAVMFCAAALAVFGAVVIIQHEDMLDQLAVTTEHGWWAVGLAAALLVGALLTPMGSRRRVRRRGVADTVVTDDRLVGDRIIGDRVVDERVEERDRGAIW